MKRDPYSDFARKVLLTSLFLCLCFDASCNGNSCFVGVWNGSGAVVGVSNNPCVLPKPTGAVMVHLGSIPSRASGHNSSSSSPQAIDHIFVTLRGVQAHVKVDAEEAAPDWEDLAPDLIAHPIQVDLLALSEDPSGSDLFADAMAKAIVPADEYRQIRFRLLPAEPSATDALPEGNACGNAGGNCIIFKDGSVRALVFGAGESEFRFLPIRNDQSLFRVLPDGLTSLSLQFDPASSVAWRSGDALRLISTFKVSPDFRSPSDDQTKSLANGNQRQRSGVDP